MPLSPFYIYAYVDRHKHFLLNNRDANAAGRRRILALADDMKK